MKVALIKSPLAEKKWRAVFTDEDGKGGDGAPSRGVTHTDFGSAGMTDYTLSKDPLRRANYLSRHRSRENWNDYTSAGALSRHLLWGDSTSLQQNLRNFKRRFSLQ
jgi:hypothetical protein